MKEPLVSIISVNYNQLQVTKELVHSVASQDWDNLEFILVDNGSDSNPTTEIQEEFPWVRMIRSEVNLGFAGGNNLGIKASRGDYLLFLNNDTELSVGVIKHMVRALAERDDAGAVSPLIYYCDEPHLLQYGGYTKINPFTGRNHSIGYKQTWGLQDEVKETPFIHGAAVMVARSVVAEIGGMPENYFLYYEELDWGRKMSKAGYKLLVTHSAAVAHKESVSTGKTSPLKTYFQTRNRILFMRRNFGWMTRMPFLIFFTLVAIPKNVLIHAKNRDWLHLKSFCQGVLWNIRNDKDSLKIGYIYDQLRGVD